MIPLLAALTYLHAIGNIQIRSEMVELQDGSLWHVAPTDLYKVVHWQPGEKIVITPNQWNIIPFANFPFYMSNLSQDSYVKVSILPGSLPQSLIALDRLEGYLFLSDASCWRIDPSDIPTLQEWQSEDPIFFGFNDESLYLLINSRTNQSVTAQHF